MAGTLRMGGLAGLLLTLVLTASSARAAAPSPSDGAGAVPAATGSAPVALQAPAEVRLDGPDLVLAGLPFTLRIERPDPGEETAEAGEEARTYRVVTSSGREVGRVELAPGASDSLTELELGGEDFPLSVQTEEDEAATFDVAVVPGWVSVLPPLVAIAMALIFREVVVSLFLGVWLGAFFFTGMDPLAATWRTVDRFVTPALADEAHASIIVFSLLLGGMVGVIAKCGGTQGIVNAVRPLATTPRRAQFATYLAGLAIFFDDYANTLIVGNTMRPITDRMKVSREKLAYIVDSTAAPIAAIVFVSTWVGFEISLIGDGLAIAAEQAGTDPALAAELLDANPFTVFIHSIPYLFYPILALVFVGMIVFLQRDFGPMWEAENRASRGGGLFREDAMLMADTSGGAMEPAEDAPERWYNAAAPVLTVIVVVLLGLFFGGRAAAGPGASLWDVFGAADPFAALLWGSLAGCVVAIGLAVGQRILSVQDAVEAWLGGMRAMMLAAVILVLAWSLSEVTQVLGTAPFLSSVLSEGLPPFLLPVLVFVTSAAIAFATGTSWGTMGILLPLVVPLAVSMGGGVGFEGGTHYTILLGSISSVLAGAIFGDHCSPISDTTVLSSMAAGCDHVDHVRTQLPYALLVGIVGMAVGDVPTALGLSPVVSYALGIGLLFLALRFFGERDDASPQWEGGGAG